jgi:hypothetical protein
MRKGWLPSGYVNLALLRILYTLVLYAVNQPLQDQTRFIRVSSSFATYYATL